MDMDPQVIPEVSKPVEAQFVNSYTLTGDTAKDLANLAKEQGLEGVVDVRVDGTVVTNTPAQPAQPAPAQPAPQTQTPQAVEQPQAQTEQAHTQDQQVQAQQTQTPQAEVPKKFLTPEGQVDEAKVQKSLANVEDMIARYKAKEREAQQLQNRVNNPQAQQSAQLPYPAQQFPQPQAAQQQQAQPAQQYQQAPMLTPLEIQMAQDLIHESAAFGKPMDQAQAIALARVQSRALAARYQADLEATASLQKRVEDAERTRELQSLINSDPELLTEGMVDKLWQIRQDKPWINTAAEPWKEAYVYFRGMNQNRHAGQVSTPTPMRATAPAVPVSPVSRVSPTAIDPKTAPIDALEAEVRKLYPGYRGR